MEWILFTSEHAVPHHKRRKENSSNLHVETRTQSKSTIEKYRINIIENSSANKMQSWRYVEHEDLTGNTIIVTLSYFQRQKYRFTFPNFICTLFPFIPPIWRCGFMRSSVKSLRFIVASVWRRVTCLFLLHYANTAFSCMEVRLIRRCCNTV